MSRIVRHYVSCDLTGAMRAIGMDIPPASAQLNPNLVL